MKTHLKLKNGRFYNVLTGETVEKIENMNLVTIASYQDRTIFIFSDEKDVTFIHLDRDMRPASRLLTLLSGCIPFNLHTTLLSFFSEIGAQSGQSRIRLSVEGQSIPAPEHLPGLKERKRHNAEMLDAIYAALSCAPADEADLIGEADTIIEESPEMTERLSAAGLSSADLRPVRLRSVRVSTAAGESATSAVKAFRKAEARIREAMLRMMDSDPDAFAGAELEDCRRGTRAFPDHYGTHTPTSTIVKSIHRSNREGYLTINRGIPGERDTDESMNELELNYSAIIKRLEM